VKLSVPHLDCLLAYFFFQKEIFILTRALIR